MKRAIKSSVIKWYSLIFIIFLYIPLYAQTDLSLTYYLIKDDNTFRNTSLYEEWVNTVSFYTGQTFRGDASMLKLYYTGDYSTFSNYKDRQNNAHKFGFAANPIIDAKKVLSIGGSAQIRRNKEDYVYYNKDAYNFYANFRYEPKLTDIYTFGLNLEKSKFKEFSEIDNLEYRFWGRYQKFFQSRLSLMGEIGFGVKDYVNQKKLSFFGFSQGMTGQIPRTIEESVLARIFSGSFNIGKSLTNKTGLNVRAGGQWYIGDPIEAYTDGIYYYTENDLYDDPYSYENRYAGINLTRLLGYGIQGKIGAEYHHKDYSGTPALDMEGELQGTYRIDKRKNYSFLLTKSFYTNWKLPNTFDLFVRYLFRDNVSNDPYYDYYDHLGMVGISVGLKQF